MASASGQEADDDYMSSDILNLCGDTRPGLMSRDAARAIKDKRRRQELDQQNRTKPLRQLERENRDQALHTAINQNNKGFALMQKMGFKPGMSLGKTGQEGRKEPVPIELKVNRRGLGHEQELKRKQEASGIARMATIQKRQKHHKNLAQDYQSRKRNELLDKLTEKDLYDSQKVCHQLDEKLNLSEPSEVFFWPKVVQETNEDESEEEEDKEDVDEGVEEEFSSSEKLKILTEYLRSTHYYCVWCGTAYNDAEDMQQNCPGNTRQDHDD